MPCVDEPGAHDTVGWSCGIYEHRPDACRRYPWEHAQVLFPECVFVRGGVVLDAAAVTAALGGPDAVADACRRCGRCCFGWSVTERRLRPEVRCSHLVRVRSCGQPSAPLAPDQQEMMAVTRTRAFDR